MDMETNPFCAAGMHLPNGSFATFGGNGAITTGGNIGDDFPAGAGSAYWDSTYQDYDGTKAIRIINPCSSSISDTDLNTDCTWYDSPTGLQMQKHRWYPAAEPLADGSVVLVGGFVNGGYINRNTPNTDPEYSNGAAEPTYEFYPSKGDAEVMQFMIKTSGLNAYAHTYLMPSGLMFVQANYSTILWNYTANTETTLPDMPDQIVRVYPASGATAMLPLTPANNYTPTILFCGGSDMTDDQWGNYSFPMIDTFNYPASTDCHTITPEPTDGSDPVYVQDDDLPVGRTMGQFIALPDGTMLVINGGANGTAGYAEHTAETLSYSDMPYGMSLCAAPVLQPAIYDPSQPLGSRWSTAGLSSSTIPRLYHSSAMLMPDASVFIAGSNPNVDVNLTTYFPTTYEAEIFYPPYFAATTRPSPQNIPSKLTYGGSYFDILVPASSYSGTANDAASNTSIWLMRGGFTTHAMNMGQRALQLNNTYSVQSNGSIILHVSQPPPNPNLFQPGPGWVYVTVNGIPSNGTYVLVGSGSIETQPTSAVVSLPTSVRLDSASGTADGSDTGSSSGGSTSHTGAIIGGIVAAIAAVGVLGAIFGICLARRRRAAAQAAGEKGGYAMRSTSLGSGAGGYAAGGAAAGMAGRGAGGGGGGIRTSESSAFVPLQGNMSTASLNSPYQDNDPYSGGGQQPHGGQQGAQRFGDEDGRETPLSYYGGTRSGEFDPYYGDNAQRMSTSQGPPRY